MVERRSFSRYLPLASMNWAWCPETEGSLMRKSLSDFHPTVASAPSNRNTVSPWPGMLNTRRPRRAGSTPGFSPEEGWSRKRLSTMPKRSESPS